VIGESYFVLGIRARQACHRLSASANKQFFLLKPSCSSEYEHLSHLSLSLQQRSASHRPLASANPSLTQSSRSIMENLALHSADEPDDLRATTGTVEVIIISYKRSLIRDPLSRKKPDLFINTSPRHVTQFCLSQPP